MTKHDILVKILDAICANAPSDFRSYYFEGKNQEEIDNLRSKAFIHLYLYVKYGISDFKLRHDLITDGPNDGGIDAYYIDEDKRKINIIQAKYRTTKKNFENTDIDIDELIVMDVERIMQGEDKDEKGNKYNGKIQGFQSKISKIGDIARYDFNIVILANLKNSTVLDRIFGKYNHEVFNYERSYNELLYPMCTSTYFDEKNIEFSLNIESSNINDLTENFETSYGNCDVSIAFVPLMEIAREVNKYKNSILSYNPRNYLSLVKNKVNKHIEETILEEEKDDFSLCNNGITVICSEYSSTNRTGKKNTSQITVKNPQIINGGQTAYTLSKIYKSQDNEKLKDKKVLMKFISINNEEKNKEYFDFINRISNATNSQTKIDEADRRSNEEIQRSLQKEIFIKYGLFYERKSGEFANALDNSYINENLLIKREEFLRAKLAFDGFAGEARNKSGDKVFEAAEFNKILNTSVVVSKVLVAYFTYKKTMELEKLYRKENYREGDWGSAIRYGKYAVVEAVACQVKYKKIDTESMTLDNLFEVIEDLINTVLSNWICFEQYIIKKEQNDRYFNNESNEFDNYYKSTNINCDIIEYFEKEIKMKEKEATIIEEDKIEALDNANKRTKYISIAKKCKNKRINGSKNAMIETLSYIFNNYKIDDLDEIDNYNLWIVKNKEEIAAKEKPGYFAKTDIIKDKEGNILFYIGVHSSTADKRKQMDAICKLYKVGSNIIFWNSSNEIEEQGDIYKW